MKNIVKNGEKYMKRNEEIKNDIEFMNLMGHFVSVIYKTERVAFIDDRGGTWEIEFHSSSPAVSSMMPYTLDEILQYFLSEHKNSYKKEHDLMQTGWTQWCNMENCSEKETLNEQLKPHGLKVVFKNVEAANSKWFRIVKK